MRLMSSKSSSRPLASISRQCAAIDSLTRLVPIDRPKVERIDQLSDRLEQRPRLRKDRQARHPGEFRLSEKLADDVLAVCSVVGYDRAPPPDQPARRRRSVRIPAASPRSSRYRRVRRSCRRARSTPFRMPPRRLPRAAYGVELVDAAERASEEQRGRQRRRQRRREHDDAGDARDLRRHHPHQGGHAELASLMRRRRLNAKAIAELHTAFRLPRRTRSRAGVGARESA